MFEATFMKTVRDILNTAVQECTIQEFKEEYILRQYNLKLQNVRKHVDSQNMNRNHKLKYYKVLDSAKLPFMNAKHYDLMKAEIKTKINGLPSMIQFVKR